MKKLITLPLFAILLWGNSLLSQVGPEWVSRYNGPPGNSGDEASALVIDGSGNVYATGESYSGSGTGTDYATVKYNSSGIQQWAVSYNGPGNSIDFATSIAVDGSGNVYATGYSTGSGTASDIATIKYNSSGIQQWAARYNGTGGGDDMAHSITVDGSGNVYITGASRGAASERDFVTIKYNSNGVQQWASRYNSGVNIYAAAFSIAVDGAGNVFVTGECSNGATFRDYTTIKYNSSGIQQWASSYNGPANRNDYAYSLTVDISGNVYVTGQSYILGGSSTSDYATVKYNSFGGQEWVQRYHGTAVDSNSNNIARFISVDSSGNVFVTGSSKGTGTGLDYATVKYNSSGVQQWVSRYNGPPGYDADEAYSLAVDNLGNVYVTGASYGGATSLDYATIKYNSSGVQQWVQRYNGTGNIGDAAYSVAVDNQGNVFVTGESMGSGTGYDYATIKYSQQVGIQSISSEIPNSFSLSQNYPNPFNPTTNIEFQIAQSGFVKLIIYDAMGREIESLVSGDLKPGTYEVDWSAVGGARDYPSGVYFYTIRTTGFTETKRMMLLK